MSRTHHHQRPDTDWVWNAPPISPDAPSPFPYAQDVASATECTGLAAQPILSQSECVDYEALYSIHEQKPQGNIGKDNPNNDPDEINFHRT